MVPPAQGVPWAAPRGGRRYGWHSATRIAKRAGLGRPGAGPWNTPPRPGSTLAGPPWGRRYGWHSATRIARRAGLGRPGAGPWNTPSSKAYLGRSPRGTPIRVAFSHPYRQAGQLGAARRSAPNTVAARGEMGRRLGKRPDVESSRTRRATYILSGGAAPMVVGPGLSTQRGPRSNRIQALLLVTFPGPAGKVTRLPGRDPAGFAHRADNGDNPPTAHPPPPTHRSRHHRSTQQRNAPP